MSFSRYLGTIMKNVVEKEINIQAPWGKLSALTWGSPSDPPVLLCHGKMDVCSSFRPLVSLLPRTFYYVSLELPGNGKSDPFPSSGRYTTADYVPAVLAVQNHFKWDNFRYIGHSLGVVVGKYFNLAYPGVITRMVELDPVPAHHTWSPKDFPSWYHTFYGEFYREGRYQIYTSSLESAPKYTYQKALDLMMNARGLNEECARHVLERSLQPAGDGLFRFTYDQRQREITRLPFTAEYLKELYTSVTITPTLCILSEVIVEMGAYEATPFVKDERSWPHGNYRVRTAPGGHDFHINTPELIAQDISAFLTETKAKL